MDYLKIDDNIMYLIEVVMDNFDIENQIYKTLEELTELQLAIHHFLKNKKNNLNFNDFKNIEEEIADVYVMLFQIRKFFGILDKNLNFIMDKKVKNVVENIKIKSI